MPLWDAEVLGVSLQLCSRKGWEPLSWRGFPVGPFPEGKSLLTSNGATALKGLVWGGEGGGALQ